MKFRRGSTYHQVSECGEYTIAKVIVGGVTQYEAWHLPKDTKQQIALGARNPSALDAMGICRRHHEKRGTKAA